MHDIQHIHYPEYFNYFVRKFRTRNYMYTAKSCNYLQASSKYIKKDFLKNFSFLKQNQVFMINEGVNIKNFKINKRTALKNISKYNLPSEFIFYPAQLWHHKNHITILKALKKIRDKDNLQINLVLTGEKFSASKTIFKKIDEFNLQNQIFYLGKVTFKDLLSLYSVSKFFITATLYESSSLPALESACIGTPIIASATPPNKEMSSLLKLNLFDAGDFNSLSRVILEIWSDREKIKKQINHNLKHVKNYSWNNIALKYCDFFHSFLSEK